MTNHYFHTDTQHFLNPCSLSFTLLQNVPSPSYCFFNKHSITLCIILIPYFQYPFLYRRLRIRLPIRFLWILPSLNIQLQQSTFLQANKPDPSTPLLLITSLLPYLDADSSELPSQQHLEQCKQPDSLLNHAEDPISLHHQQALR